MDINTTLYDFMKLAGEDPRMGPSHISLFMAVIYFYNEQNYAIPIRVFRRDLKRQARILGASTYHKCLHDLIAAGYIRYVPSFNAETGSQIYIGKSDK